MASIITPNIFKPWPEVRAALTLRGKGKLPYGINFSHAVGDDPVRVEENRRCLAGQLGFAPERLATQKQVHGAESVYVADGYCPGESDALITDRPGWLLAASVADCIPVLLYEPERKVVAAVHSGWRGSQRNIVGSTIARMRGEFDLSTDRLCAWIGPSAGQCCYEVGEDVAGAFDPERSRSLGKGKYLFDNKGVVLGQLLDAGLCSEQIEVDIRCTICDDRFQSYRRDGGRSGRMVAVIGMREE